MDGGAKMKILKNTKQNQTNPNFFTASVRKYSKSSFSLQPLRGIDKKSLFFSSFGSNN
jgi:hypothetical protein